MQLLSHFSNNRTIQVSWHFKKMSHVVLISAGFLQGVQSSSHLSPALFFSRTSSICLCLLSNTSSRLASLRDRSCSLISTRSSRNICLHAQDRIMISGITSKMLFSLKIFGSWLYPVDTTCDLSRSRLV